MEESKIFPGFKGDKGLVAKSPAAHHAISALLDTPLDNKGKTLVVQYEVKFQESLECGGAYIKLLSETDALRTEEFSNDAPYQIMFGPDKCGSTNKVHFIIRRKNPNTGEYEEKHLKNPAPARLSKVSNLYTLIIKENQDFDVRINGKSVRSGNLHEEGAMFPSVNPPAEIEDVDDEKPEDWVDSVTIPDPEQAVKPEDWDETEPKKIPDPNEVKPEDWDEDALEFIADPDAEVPEDWDEEEDGEFISLDIPNPECELHGCGPWTAPLIDNPKYKGRWDQPRIQNPDYIGPWTPRMIPNPDYYEDATPSDLEPIGAIGIEIWTMQKDILFDNFYLGHSIEEAEAIGNATFVPKAEIETAQEKKVFDTEVKQQQQQRRKTYDNKLDHFSEDPLDFLTELVRSFILNMSVDPVTYIKNQPVVFIGCVTAIFTFGAIAIAVLGVFFVLIKSIFVSKPAVEAPKKKEAVDKVVKPSAKSSATAPGSAVKRSKAAE